MANVPIEALPLAPQVFDDDIIVMQTSDGAASKVKGSRFLRSSSVAAIASLSGGASQGAVIAKLNEILSALQAGVPEGWTGPQPASFSVAAPANFPEGTGTPTQRAFTVTITGDRSITRTVDWAISGGTTNPVNAGDLVDGFSSGTLSFAPSDSATKSVLFTPVADSAVEPDETIRCTISNPTGAGSTIAIATAEATVLNDDSAPTAPGAIGDLVAVPGAAQAVLTWTAPAANGAAITDYVIQYRVSGSSTWLTFTDAVSASTGATVTGLINGLIYEFSVLAVNSAGSTRSNIATATPIAALPPSAITDLGGTPGDGKVDLAWTAPAANGAPITDYIIQWRAVGATPWTTFADGVSSATTATITGRTNDVPIEISVLAVNSAGQTRSNIITRMPIPAPLLDRVAGAARSFSSCRVNKAGQTNPATFSGGALATLKEQANGTTTTPTAIAKGPGTINGYDYVKFNGSSDKIAFQSLALGTGDFDIFMAVGVPTNQGYTALGAMVGRSSGTTSIRGNGSSNIDTRSDSAGPISRNMTTPKVPGIDIIRVKRRGSSVTFLVNREDLGTSTVSGNFTFDRIGVSYDGVTPAAWSNMGWLECHIFTGTMSDADAEIVWTDMSVLRSGIYVSNSGSDTGYGWNPETAFATISKARQFSHRRGSTIHLQCGSTWRRDPIYLGGGLTYAGTSTDPVRFKSYGTGPLPRQIGSEQATGFTATGTGTEYSTTLSGASSVQAIWAVHKSNTKAEVILGRGSWIAPEVIILTPGTAGSLAVNEYAVSGTTITINVGGPLTNYDIEVAHLGGNVDAEGNGVRLTPNNILIQDFQTWFDAGNGVRHEGNNNKILRVECWYPAYDGAGGSGTGLVEDYVFAFYPGQVRGLIGAKGDCFSCHGAATIARSNGGGIGGRKAGIDDQETVIATNTAMYIKGAFFNGYTASSSGTAGTHKYENCIFVRVAGDSVDAYTHSQAVNAEFNNCTFVNLGTRAGTAAIRTSSSGTCTVRNCVMVGFEKRINYTGTGGLTHDHNVYDVGSAYGTGQTAGTGDVIADPLFVDAANDNYKLQAGSPAIGAGVAISGLTTDFGGNAVHSPPDCGAFDRAA